MSRKLMIMSPTMNIFLLFKKVLESDPICGPYKERTTNWGKIVSNAQKDYAAEGYFKNLQTPNLQDKIGENGTWIVEHTKLDNWEQIQSGSAEEVNVERYNDIGDL